MSAAASNLDSVLDQLRAGGLIVDGITSGQLVRCRVEGDREKRGWYILHELTTRDGDVVLVGSFGVWQGASNNATKIELRKGTFDDEQRRALAKRMREDRQRADRVAAGNAKRAAARAAAAWAKCSEAGDSEYLARKGVGAHGVRFSPSGALVVPMLNATNQIQGLQIIRPKSATERGRKLAKEFWPAGVAKRGTFHLIGLPGPVALIAEGYATAASLHEATGLPVAVAWDAGNIGPVATALHARYPRTRWLICADDDILARCRAPACRARLVLSDHPHDCPTCGEPHGCSNAGITHASTAAVAIDGAFTRPEFADEAGRRAAWLERGTKITDYNDLHLAEGLHVVRAQVEARLSALRWDRVSPRATSSPGGAGGAALRPIQTTDELLERFALIYGMNGAVFDRQEHRVVTLSDVLHACAHREIHRAWMQHPDRKIVRETEVDFDPSESDPNITCNLWAGWPTQPRAGNCTKLLELLRYMCSADAHAERLYQWVLRWIAYPIQHPGAKMRSTIVVHGPQGAGKNLFFEALKEIYGTYGRVIDQSAIEDKFNDWASRRMFLIADEVVARLELFHVKNKLKAFITGEWIRINAKNLQPRDERNHVNMVFLSNETMPVALEEDDRRHAVIWTPAGLPPEFYQDVADEMRNGGVAALHDYLLHVDLGDFDPHTRPPYTDAKEELINLGRDSPTRFHNDLLTQDIACLPYAPALSRDVYQAYKHYCADIGVRPASMPKFVNALVRRHDVPCERKRYMDDYGGQVGPHGVLLFGSGQPPEGKLEGAWLGECISAWRNALKDYRGSRDP